MFVANASSTGANEASKWKKWTLQPAIRSLFLVRHQQHRDSATRSNSFMSLCVRDGIIESPNQDALTADKGGSRYTNPACVCLLVCSYEDDGTRCAWVLTGLSSATKLKVAA